MITANQQKKRIQQLITLDNQTFKKTDSYFQTALLSIKDNLTLFYNQYADENGLSITQTASRVNKWDLNQWKKVISSFDMSDWPIEAQDRAVIYGTQAGQSRKALIGAIIGINLVGASVNVQNTIKQRMQSDGEDEVKRLKKQSKLTSKQSKKVSSVITDPNNVKDWSNNLWVDNETLANDVENLVNKHLKHGMNLDDLQDLLMSHTNPKQFKPNQNIGDRIKSAQNNAKRIIRTESSRLVDHANMATFRQQGIKEVDWITEPGACDLCLSYEHNGPYLLNEAPLIPDDSHPNCRCMKSPHIND